MYSVERESLHEDTCGPVGGGGVRGRERLTKIKATTRPAHVWPEVWTKIGKAAEKKEIEEWVWSMLRADALSFQRNLEPTRVRWKSGRARADEVRHNDHYTDMGLTHPPPPLSLASANTAKWLRAVQCVKTRHVLRCHPLHPSRIGRRIPEFGQLFQLERMLTLRFLIHSNLDRPPCNDNTERDN